MYAVVWLLALMLACQQQIRGACRLLLPHPSAACEMLRHFARTVVWPMPYSACLLPARADLCVGAGFVFVSCHVSE